MNINLLQYSKKRTGDQICFEQNDYLKKQVEGWHQLVE